MMRLNSKLLCKWLVLCLLLGIVSYGFAEDIELTDQHDENNEIQVVAGESSDLIIEDAIEDMPEIFLDIGSGIEFNELNDNLEFGTEGIDLKDEVIDNSIQENGSAAGESSAYNRILIYDQYGGGWANWTLNYGATGGNNMENGGCHIFAYAHTVQWLTGKKLSYENRATLIEELISVCDIPWGPTSYNKTDPQALYNSHIISKYGVKAKTVPGSGMAMEELFNQGGVVIANPGGHYIIAVGAAYDDLDRNGSNEYYIHIVDSSCQSTWWRTNQNYGSNLYDFSSRGSIQGYSKSGNGYINGTVNGVSKSKWGGGEYWVPYSVFSKYRLDRAYIPGDGGNQPIHDYSYKVLYKECCAYKVVKAFNWHTGPSAYESTAGSASVGETFYTDTVVWNTTTNNMWVKKKGENKYVFAGLHWSDNKWYVDKTQTQYLEFVGDSSSAEWNGCNLSGTLPQGESFALKGTLDASATMTYVWAEFYKGKSCWGQPTSSCEINSTSYTLYNSALDWSLKFGSLSSGDYELVLHIYGISDRGQKQSGYTITKPFSISGPKDTTSPTISNVEVSNVSSYGYTVTCTVSDNVGVTSVKFPTWTEPNGQDDIVWHEGTLSGSKASFTLNVSDHNNETGCLYITHIYAYDAAGNNTCQGVNVDVPAVDTIAPTVSDLKATDISSEGFTANCTVSDNVGVTKVQFLVCVGNEPWGDGIWHDATISGNKASGRIQVSEHGYRRNEQYFIRAFAWDAAGNEGEYYAMLCIGVPDEETEAETTPTPAPKTNLSKAKLTVKAQVYTGKALKPAVKVVLKDKTLRKGTDYTVSYKNNKAIGTATVTVKGKGNYTGTAKTTFKINPKAVSGLKLTAGKKKLTVTWKKGSGIMGYQLQYGLKKSFSGAKKATVSKASTVKGTIKNLKKGKIYYVRIRAFKKVGKTTYWSAWSAAKKAKVK